MQSCHRERTTESTTEEPTTGPVGRNAVACPLREKERKITGKCVLIRAWREKARTDLSIAFQQAPGAVWNLLSNWVSNFMEVTSYEARKRTIKNFLILVNRFTLPVRRVVASCRRGEHSLSLSL